VTTDVAEPVPSPPFRVGLSPDVRGPDGRPALDLSLQVLDAVDGIEWAFIEDRGAPELDPDQVGEFDAVILADASVVRRTLAGAGRLAHVARLGVGFDDLDVAGCTEQGVVITNAPAGVRRPMAVSAILFVLALAHRLLVKDRLTRSGRWDEQWGYLGTGVTGLTLGLVGVGNIGREICRLARAFELEVIAFDPYVDDATAADVGFRRVELDALMSQADFVCVCCPLTGETRHLVDAGRIARMKSTAYLVNLARGPIVEEAALVAALRDGRIQGAGLDVFEHEPVDPGNPLLSLDNVIVTPHSIGHTDELFRSCGEIACRNIVAFLSGEAPGNVVNPRVLDHPRVRRLLAEPRLPRGRR
jgi:phosphoglycerate dehydrogenase-like enzyme